MDTTAKLTILENAPLALYTTLGVGGPARFLIKAATEEQVLEGLQFARKAGCPVFVLGGGSNIVVSDSGFPGLVIKIELSGITEEDGPEKISAAAGEEWDGFVRHCVERNLAGIECLSGIPGTVGGTPVQNVGAYGEEVSDVIFRVRVLDRDRCSIEDLSSTNCRFSYRTSIFNTVFKDRYVVLRVDFALRPNGEPRITYQDLQRHFDGRTAFPTLREVREAVLRIRELKGMVLQARDPDSRSAGSIFKNPVLSTDNASFVEERARALGLLKQGERIPRFTAPSGQEKLPAAWLVERAGFPRGYRSGRTGISTKHSLALVNCGGATAREILDLMHSVQDRVQTLFGIELQPEPVFVGFETPE